jgi:hypothetical protein
MGRKGSARGAEAHGTLRAHSCQDSPQTCGAKFVCRYAPEGALQVHARQAGEPDLSGPDSALWLETSSAQSPG